MMKQAVMRIRSFISAITALGLAPAAVADADGILGPTSTGTADVSANLVAAPEPNIQISNLFDLEIADIEIGDENTHSITDSLVCVWSPVPLNYSLQVDLPELTGSTSGEQLAFEVMVVTLENYQPIQRIYSTAPQPLLVETITAASNETCAFDSTFRYRVSLDGALLNNAIPDTYSTTLTFTVTPE